MYRGALERIIILFIAIKTFFVVIYDFLKWFFTRTVVMVLNTILLLLAIFWCFGFYNYVGDINRNVGEIVLSTPKFHEKTDALIVLTGGSERVRNALYMLDKGAGKALFISGVNRDVKKHEIFALHQYGLKKYKKLNKKVFLGYSANDTFENAIEIKKWVTKNKVKSIRLITSNYHIKRAMLEIKHLLPNLKIIPHQVIPINVRLDKWWKFSNSRKLLFKEYNKYLAARIRIFIESL